MTVRENLLPSAMVPGLVTIEDKKGRRQNLYPVDAREAIASGEYTLVENGAVEAARLAATPLRSGMADGLATDQIVAEVSGIEGRIVMGADAKTAAKLIEAGDNAEANHDKPAASTGNPEGKKTQPAGGQQGAAEKK